MRILIVEDDARIASPVAEELRALHNAVDVVGDGREGLAYAEAGVYDLLVLDIMLPGIDGLELCRRLREAGSTAMILMMTARDSVEDKVRALDAGADDYIVKPFDLAELAARVRALGRRPRDARQPVLEHGGIRVDPARRDVSYDGRPLVLTRSEFAILETLLRNPLQIFSRAMLLDKIRDYESSSASDSIKTHVGNLRRKIRNAGARAEIIETVYGTGYRLADLPG